MTPRTNYLILIFAAAVNFAVGIPKLMRHDYWGLASIFAAMIVIAAGVRLFFAERHRKHMIAERDAWFARLKEAAEVPWMGEADIQIIEHDPRTGEQIAAELNAIAKECSASLGLSYAMQCERRHHARVAIGGGGHFGDDLLTCVDCHMERYDGSWEGHTIGEVRDRLLGSEGTYEPVRAEDWGKMSPTSRTVVSL